MRMSGTERRLQLLLDQERHERISRAAQRSRRSVSAVIRNAIDLACPGDVEARMAAAQSLLAMGEPTTEAPEDDWATIKAARSLASATSSTRG